MKIKNNSIKRNNEENIIIANIDDVSQDPIGIRRPVPFYISLRLEGWVVNNCMIDTRVARPLFPKLL